MYVLLPTPRNAATKDTFRFHKAVRQFGFKLDRAERSDSCSLKGGRMHAAIAMFLLLLFCEGWATAQQVETSLPLSQRLTINLAAGVPEYIADAASGSSTPQSQWWFENTNNSTRYSSPSFMESNDTSANWQQVGLPYDANIPRTFINQTSGGGQGSLTGQQNWYRLHFKVDPKYAGQKFMLNIEGSHTAVQVFINGTLLPGISAVAANAQATHVVGFIPVIVDLTPYLHTDGVTDNVIAVDVSRGDSWFEQPGFSGAFRFGQAMAGLFRNVYLYVSNPVHIPLNIYSNQKTWGTYVGTVSEVPAAEGTATAGSAVVEVQTNVLNETASAQQVTLTIQIVDARGNVVVTAPPITQSVPAMTPSTFPSGPTPMFQQLITVPTPTLWYPNNSTCGTPAVSCGTPYMYKVYHIVSVNGVVVDSMQSPLGIRTITWDANFPYFNGHAIYLWGGSGRYDYPALGSSVPDEQWWRDMAQIAAQGGNVWRVGHSTSSEELVEAADAYGIMIDQPSGDGEGYWNAASNPTADNLTLKQELHRDMIIRDRNHPSILDWEEDNGGMNPALADELATIETQWDNINPRVQADRTYSPAYAYMGECDGAGCEAGLKTTAGNQNNPAFGAEYWDNMGTGRGLAWDYEIAFAAPYLDDWRQGREANAFGMAQWYFADSPGEVSLYAEFQNQPAKINMVRSLGYSSVDMNRFPRLLYYIYQANWIPYSIQPVVHLAHHWNRAYQYTPGTPIQENAFSNCPAVRLLINGVPKDPVTAAVLADQTPNPWNINSHADLTQNTTVMPGQVHWMVNWTPGTVTAECIDVNGNVVPGVTDSRTTAGPENKIVLSVVPEVTKPDGTIFQWTANGSDAAFVQAEVEDANGNIVPTAADNITFSVTGPATYMGGSQQYVADPSWTTYYQDAFSQAHSTVINGLPYAFFHSPGDPELNLEGGLQKIALRSTFTSGAVTVTATAPGLASGSVTLSSVAPPAPPQSQPPAIIVPPVNTATTAGYSAKFLVAASGSGTLTYQWSENGIAVGTNSSTYTTPATTLAENGDTITVTISSSFGSVTSTPVTLTVDSPANVAITTPPASQTVIVGQAATLKVIATGSPALNYAWYENGTQVQSGPQASYTTPILMSTGTESFYVIVSNSVGQVQSSTAVVTVIAPTPVSITTEPAGQIVATNQPVQFTAVVAGSAPYTYQWQFTPMGGSSIILQSNTQNSNTITYTIPAMSSADVGAYTVTVNNAANIPVTSTRAQLTLAPPGVNLVLDRTATSSSTQNACNDGTTTPPYTGTGCLGPENAVDGNLQSRWGSATANASPTPPVAGVDPSWLQVDLGSVQAFNTVIINWENAYATQYKIQYTSGDPTVASNWLTAFTNNAGTGGVNQESFPTVQGRYIRLLGEQRATQYGYSVYEFQVYNVAQCGGSSERYTISSTNPSLVTDNQTNLTWTRTIQTDTAPGSQFTGVDAAAFCSSINMRLPAKSEALGISGSNNASCAFSGAWSTWTSTVDPNDASETAIVNFDGTTSWNVTNNYPGQTLCDSGTSLAQGPVIQTQPQSTTVAVGQTATFTVTAGNTGPFTYQWFENGAAITGATAASYTTPVLAATDNGKQYSVAVTNLGGTVNSNTATLTVTNITAPAITTQPASQTVNVGSTATFTVTATGTAPLTYQWFENGTAIAGATAASYTTPVLAATDCGEKYSVTVTNATGVTVTSTTATLTVNAGSVQPTTPNLALNRPATSSGNENAGMGPLNAVDGNLTTRWSSAFVDPSWIEVDLGAPQSIDEVVLYWQAAYGIQYQIQVSNDQQNWTPVYTQTNGQGGIETLAFATVVDRYIRMYGTGRATPYGYSLFEFQVYGADVPIILTQPASQNVAAGSAATFSVAAGGQGPFTYQWMLNGMSIPGATASTYTTPSLTSVNNGNIYTVAVSNANGPAFSAQAVLTVTSSVPTGANLALGKLATSSGNENDGLGPQYAVDGNMTTRWSSAFVDPSWIQVDLGESTQIGQVVLYWQAAYGVQYQIQVSNDQQNWTTAFTQTHGQGGVESITFPPVTGRYVRMYGTQRSTQYGYSLFEFQIYASTAPTIAIQPVSQTVNVGNTATFTATAGGTGPFTYQWFESGAAIPGATSTSYTTPVLAAMDNGKQYSVAVTNLGGTVNSNTATLTVTNITAPAITTQPTNQTANVSGTATFTVTATGTMPLTYQWFENGTAIAGATAASYTTPVLAATDNGGKYSVTVTNATGVTVTSTTATLTVGSYAIYPGYIGVDLNNNTNGVWTNSQIYVTVIGLDPATKQYGYLTFAGAIIDFTVNDSSAANHLTTNGQNYGNYSFTLAESTLLKIPPFISARAYISLGAPMYIQVNGDGNGNVAGYAGPNPQNPTDPNINTHFDWYEFNYQNGLFINTTQVDEFGLPLLLDVWGSGGTFHRQVGIAESIAQIDSEFATQVPAQFQPPTMSNLRILSPSKLSMAAGGANANYFDNYIANAWNSYATTPLSITLNGRQFRGTASGSTLTFTEVNPVAANVGETFVVQRPSTQDVLGCAGTLASGVSGTTTQTQDENAVQLQLENQICSATNRGVLTNPANWANVSSYYGSAPANFYSQFWHNHSIGGLAYGFSYDDNNNQSTTIATPQPEHMAFGIGW